MGDASDFNDLAQAEGLEAVRSQIAQSIAQQELDAWPQPTMGATSAPELTADLLPGWLGQFVAALAAATQTPVTMSALTALSVVATAVQRRRMVRVHGGYIESLSFWSLTAAPSGARKSAVLRSLLEPLEYWERQARERMRRPIADVNSRIMACESRIKGLQAKIAKTDDGEERERLRREIAHEEEQMPERLFAPLAFSGDVTVEALQQVLVEQGGRAAVLAAEGGLFSTLTASYGGSGGPSLDVLLEGFSGGAVRVTRAGRAAYVDRAAVALGLLLQPDLLNEAAGSTRFRASGLMARFAFALPGQFVGGRNVRKYSAVPDDVRQAYEAGLAGLLPDVATEGPHTKPGIVILSPGALEVWFQFAQWVEDELAPGAELAAISDWGAKLAGLAARVAALFEFVTSGIDAQEVSETTMQQAVRLCLALVPHARLAFRLLAADQADRDADYLLQWVLRQSCGEFLQSAAHRELHGRFTKLERLQEALRRLQANRCIRHTTKKNPGARASSVWLINPRLFHQ
ncbi:YfjI family protein [Comamonas sp. NLF-1-9]|uniref:YfjI family protein n=1 Tax=Comamonas sp. NLF-1-9 TaxID=2853163 RepID=UPI001C452DE0|nr:YfjI family protein [Comamonas sp. NLF-1-9]QXL83267.1 DUF3987 domain-containing protein [Comamonas sp. NLF-1-9]